MCLVRAIVLEYIKHYSRNQKDERGHIYFVQINYVKYVRTVKKEQKGERLCDY